MPQHPLVSNACMHGTGRDREAREGPGGQGVMERGSERRRERETLKGKRHCERERERDLEYEREREREETL